MAKDDILPPAINAGQNLGLFVEHEILPNPPMLHEPAGDLEFKIGHVLFIDIVDYSKLLLHAQSERLRELNDLLRGTKQFQRAAAKNSLLRLPTGDGVALIFGDSPETPAQCALEISESLKAHPQLHLRMGIHSGPVSEVSDVNERANIAGAGINIAQRVMDCGDAGHILVSKHVAEDLEHSARWRPHLHELGEFEVKHGVVITIVNLFTGDLGNSAVPTKLAKKEDEKPTKGGRASTSAKLLAILVIVSLAIATFLFLNHRKPPALTRASVANTAELPAQPIPEKSIAVLPFDNLSANQETAFFTDGVQDEILTDLARVAGLKVISRTSVSQYRDQSKRNLREIAQQLGVAHIVEGSVQRANNRVRVNAQLIDARTDAHLWAQTYDRDLADVFAIQSEIAKAIVDQLQVKLSSKEQEILDAKPTNDLTAYDLYLHATQVSRNRSTAVGSGGAEETKQVIGLLDDAIAHDPNFVAAICLRAQCHLYLYWVNADSPPSHLETAGKGIETAERLQPDGGEVHLSRAIYHYWGSRNYSSALKELALARRSLPNDVRVLFFIGLIERRQGNWGDSTRHLEQALALDPCSLNIISELAGSNYLALERYSDAARTVDNALSWKPADFSLVFLRAYIDMAWKADLKRWQAAVTGDASRNADAKDLITARVDLALKQRDYRTAEQVFTSGTGTEFDDNGFFTPREWKQAIIARGMGDNAKANTLLLLARERAARAVQARADDAKAVMVLAQIDAALGRKLDAVQAGERAIKLLPIEKDALNGAQLLVRLASIYGQVGERDRAFDLLGKEIHQPYGLNYGSLKLDETWDPLRGDPRFESIVAGLAPKG